MADIPIVGTCHSCQDEDMPLTKYLGHYYCRFCLPEVKDNQKAKHARDDVKEFNKMIRKTA